MIDVKEYLKDKLAKGTVHFTRLDPDPAKLDVESAKVIAKRMQDAGTDAFMIGGSTGVTTENLGAIAIAVREATGLPTIYFPSDVHAISDEVDVMLFMSIVNSSNPKFITHYQAKAAPYIKMLNIPTIPMAYIVVEPGMTVGRVSEAKLIPRDDIEGAVGFALAARGAWRVLRRRPADPAFFQFFRSYDLPGGQLIWIEEDPLFPAVFFEKTESTIIRKRIHFGIGLYDYGMPDLNCNKGSARCTLLPEKETCL